jgi:hypothetical protein
LSLPKALKIANAIPLFLLVDILPYLQGTLLKSSRQLLVSFQKTSRPILEMWQTKRKHGVKTPKKE